MAEGIIDYDYICLFSGKTNLFYYKILHPKFRHCIIIIRTPKGWKYIDPLRSKLHISTIQETNIENLAHVYKQLGYKVLIGKKLPDKLFKKKRLLNCVSVCKRLIGIEDKFIITPRQLYNKLIKLELAVKA